MLEFVCSGVCGQVYAFKCVSSSVCVQVCECSRVSVGFCVVKYMCPSISVSKSDVLVYTCVCRCSAYVRRIKSCLRCPTRLFSLTKCSVGTEGVSKTMEESYSISRVSQFHTV